MVFWVLPIAVIAYFILRPRYIVLWRWQDKIENVQFSVDEFYRELATHIEKLKINEVSLLRVTRRADKIISPRQECLRIVYRENIHDVCVSPFGTGCYISWWQFEKRTVIQDILRQSKFMSQLMDAKTEHQIDLNNAFKGTVRTSILETIQAYTVTRGERSSRRKNQ